MIGIAVVAKTAHSTVTLSCGIEFCGSGWGHRNSLRNGGASSANLPGLSGWPRGRETETATLSIVIAQYPGAVRPLPDRVMLLLVESTYGPDSRNRGETHAD